MSESGSASVLQPAYILHYQLWQDEHMIIDAFTLNAGRVALVARGVRHAKSQVRALCQPFRPLLISWAGNGDLRTLTHVEPSGSDIVLEYERLACGYYINELLLRLVGKYQPQTALFAHYVMALSALSQGSGDYEGVLRTFEIQLLDELGVLPPLDCCTPDGTSVSREQDYLYFPAAAVALPQQTRSSLDKSVAKSAHPALHPDGVTREDGIEVDGHTLLAMSQLDFDDERVRQQSRILMRRILRHHLGEKPLKSRAFFSDDAPTTEANGRQSLM